MLFRLLVNADVKRQRKGQGVFNSIPQFLPSGRADNLLLRSRSRGGGVQHRKSFWEIEYLMINKASFVCVRFDSSVRPDVSFEHIAARQPRGSGTREPKSNAPGYISLSALSQ